MQSCQELGESWSGGSDFQAHHKMNRQEREKESKVKNSNEVEKWCKFRQELWAEFPMVVYGA